MRIEAEIIREGARPVEVVCERSYRDVQVRAEWLHSDEGPETRVVLEVIGDVACHANYAELFFHDVFLLLNLASPGAFGGTIAMGERELTLSARVFASAAPLQQIALPTVTAWLDHQHIGTQQFATTRSAAALFQLLHLARAEEDPETSILRLASAAKSLLGRPDSLRRLFDLRDAIAQNRTSVIHPMYDVTLDPRIEDASRELYEVADHAAHVVIQTLQERIAASARPTRRPPHTAHVSTLRRRAG